MRFDLRYRPHPNISSHKTRWRSVDRPIPIRKLLSYRPIRRTRCTMLRSRKTRSAWPMSRKRSTRH